MRAKARWQAVCGGRAAAGAAAVQAARSPRPCLAPVPHRFQGQDSEDLAQHLVGQGRDGGRHVERPAPNLEPSAACQQRCGFFLAPQQILANDNRTIRLHFARVVLDGGGGGGEGAKLLNLF